MASPPLPAVKCLRMMDTFIMQGAAPFGGRQELEKQNSERQKNANAVEQQHLAAILISVGSVYASRVTATAMLTHGQIEWKGRQWNVTSRAHKHFCQS